MERPLILVTRQGGRELVVAADGAAALLGIGPGLPLADARALCPALRAADHDPAGDGAALRQLAAWATRYTPWTAPCATAEGRGEGPGGAGGLLLEVTGCGHLFAGPNGTGDEAAHGEAAHGETAHGEVAGEEALLADLLRRLAAAGFTARAGLAGTIGAAWALARYGTTAQRPWVRIAPGDAAEPDAGLRTALAALPPAALRLPPAACELLARFGLRRIAQLTALPPASLAARFGETVNRRLRQALGETAECLDALLPVAALRVRRDCAEPLLTAETIDAGLAALIAALCQRLEAERRGARRLELLCYRVDASLWQIARGTSRPSRDPRHLTRLFAEAAQAIDPGFGIESLVLQAPLSEPLAADQLDLRLDARPALPAAGPAADQGRDLADLVDRLEARLGPGRLVRPQPRQSHDPARAVAFAAALSPETDGALWRPALARPLRLLPRPEPIEATALLPDHPPLQFRWRRLLHQVTAAEGPERLSPEWWRHDQAGAPEAAPGDAPPARDYFRVAVAGGGRYWLYRAERRWFLHGIFG